jgi:hypothetical protein
MAEPALDMSDEQIDAFIEDVNRKISYGEEWWLDDFFQEARVIAEELQAWRKLDASTDR